MTPTDPIEIDLGDGITRGLRYSMGSMKRLKKAFGSSLMSGDGLKGLDEDKIPVIIFEGLTNKEGIADADALADMLDVLTLPKFIKAMGQALGTAQPDAKPADPNAPSSQPVN